MTHHYLQVVTGGRRLQAASLLCLLGAAGQLVGAATVAVASTQVLHCTCQHSG